MLNRWMSNFQKGIFLSMIKKQLIKNLVISEWCRNQNWLIILTSGENYLNGHHQTVPHWFLFHRCVTMPLVFIIKTYLLKASYQTANHWLISRHNLYFNHISTTYCEMISINLSTSFCFIWLLQMSGRILHTRDCP